MNQIEKINTETNAYIDTENLVEYLFTGWDQILSWMNLLCNRALLFWECFLVRWF